MIERGVVYRSRQPGIEVEFEMKSRLSQTIGITCGAIFIVVFGPIVVWMFSAHGSAPRFHDLVNISTTFQGITLALVSYFCIGHARSRNSTEDVIVAGIFSVAAAFCLGLVNNSSDVPNADYVCIQNGAWNILQNQLPYGKATGYFLYPPMYGEAMAGLYKGILLFAKQFHCHPEPAQTFNLIFYLFQNAQLAALLCLLYCSYEFVLRTAKTSKLNAAMLSVAMIALCYPIKETIRWNQVNLYLTCLVMFACSSMHRLECVRGLALAVGIHLKAYPALILPAWFMSGQRKACVWAVVWTGIIFGLTLSQFGFAVWTSYFTTARSFINELAVSPQSYMLNGSCLYSLVFCTLKWIGSLTGTLSPMNWTLVSNICNALRAVAGIWFAARIARRHWLQKPRSQNAVRDVYYDDVCDLLSFGLIGGPTTLNHHYVLAVPVILWTLIRSGKVSPFMTVLGTVLIINFQAYIATWMPLAPVGLFLLALVRRGPVQQVSDISKLQHGSVVQPIALVTKEPSLRR